ncbi:hypothetical protein [Pseudomonas sp. FW300-N2A2]|uniref:hypothetical protein n=1 Tax=Pseudomonas sp. FW300-N2A2 TaxID=2751316 RepID=UPI001A9340C9|nr:hypothetical protein [Pseudomonas sp. FW300-N2A2]
MQTAYTVLILLMLVSVSRLVGRVIPLPLPLVQIGMVSLIGVANNADAPLCHE